MVLILDGNSKHVEHACTKIGLSEIRFAWLLSISIKRLKQILICASISDVPSNMNTMLLPKVLSVSLFVRHADLLIMRTRIKIQSV